MLVSLFLAAGLAGVVLSETNAPVINDEPAGAAFQAVLQSNKPVQGQIEGVSATNGTGVNFNINFFAFPANQGPFEYHIHEYPVPADGNCTGTGAHLDPYARTESPPCDASDPQTCQLGDLSGKHGKIKQTSTSTNFQAFYDDLYLSTQPGALAFFGNRSIVVHNSAGDRINCGNFTNAGAQNIPSATAYSATALPTGPNTAASAAATSTTAGGATATPTKNAAMAIVDGHQVSWPAAVVMAIVAAL